MPHDKNLIENISISLATIREDAAKIAQFPVVHMLTEVKEALRSIISECSKIEAELKDNDNG